MKFEKSWIAVQIENAGLWDAVIIPVSDCDNLISKLKIDGIRAAQVYNTKRAAVETVLQWRDMFRKEGIYRWEQPGDPLF